MEDDDEIKRPSSVGDLLKHFILHISEYLLIFSSRFAEFIEGSPHLRDEEILDYETTFTRGDSDSDIATDDDSDIDTGK